MKKRSRIESWIALQRHKAPRAGHVIEDPTEAFGAYRLNADCERCADMLSICFTVL